MKNNDFRSVIVNNIVGKNSPNIMLKKWGATSSKYKKIMKTVDEELNEHRIHNRRVSKLIFWQFGLLFILSIVMTTYFILIPFIADYLFSSKEIKITMLTTGYISAMISTIHINLKLLKIIFSNHYGLKEYRRDQEKKIK